jgi:hypothetical protein
MSVQELIDIFPKDKSIDYDKAVIAIHIAFSMGQTQGMNHASEVFEGLISTRGNQ